MVDRSTRCEIRLAGFGGQGLVLAGQILAEAAAVYDGKNATHTVAYGPEVRGGTSRSEVVISDGEVDYPRVISADVLLAMSQEACDKYAHELKRNGLLIVDTVHVRYVPTTRAYRVPITRIAREVTGRPITANIVALGLLVGLAEVVSRAALEAAVSARAPEGTEEINARALARGFEVAADLPREWPPLP
jgi:2-oxoglutarate ferredoxin oxidoreductase subunit gamma